MTPIMTTAPVRVAPVARAACPAIRSPRASCRLPSSCSFFRFHGAFLVAHPISAWRRPDTWALFPDTQRRRPRSARSNGATARSEPLSRRVFHRRWPADDAPSRCYSQRKPAHPLGRTPPSCAPQTTMTTDKMVSIGIKKATNTLVFASPIDRRASSDAA